MAKLFWLQADNTIVEFPLKAEQSLIGRSSRCDVRIKHPGISAEHALIRQVPGAATVEDLGSTNGTRVNGRRIEVHTLRHGDQIGVGRERLMYFAELDEASKFVQPSAMEPFAQPAPGGEQVNTLPSTAAPVAPVSAPAVTPPPAPPPPAAPTPLFAEIPLPEPDSSTSIVPSAVPARPKSTANAGDMPELDIALIASLPKGTKLSSGAPAIPAAAVARSAPAAAPAPVSIAPAAVAPPAAAAAQPAAAPRATAPTAASQRTPPAPRVQTLIGSVAVLSGPAAGKRYPLDQPSVTVGKEGKQVVEFVRAAPTRWQIKQREGVTPAYINGDALNGPRELAAGDVIELIGVRLRFEIALSN